MLVLPDSFFTESIEQELAMQIVYLAFLIGIVSGLRTFTGITAISWAARLHWLHLEQTKLAFLGYAATPYILTVLAIGELIGDQLPKTPSRTVPPQFIARILAGALCGAAFGLANGALVVALVSAIVGSVVGTLGGARFRALLAKTFGSDIPAAFLEDAIAIALAVSIVYPHAA
jgi:uncharacterized membrane protein